MTVLNHTHLQTASRNPRLGAPKGKIELLGFLQDYEILKTWKPMSEIQNIEEA